MHGSRGRPVPVALQLLPAPSNCLPGDPGGAKLKISARRACCGCGNPSDGEGKEGRGIVVAARDLLAIIADDTPSRTTARAQRFESRGDGGFMTLVVSAGRPAPLPPSQERGGCWQAPHTDPIGAALPLAVHDDLPWSAGVGRPGLRAALQSSMRSFAHSPSAGCSAPPETQPSPAACGSVQSSAGAAPAAGGAASALASRTAAPMPAGQQTASAGRAANGPWSLVLYLPDPEELDTLYTALRRAAKAERARVGLATAATPMLENPMFAGQAAPSPAGWLPSADALPPGEQAGRGSAAPIPTAPPSPPPVGAAHCEPLKRFFGVPERLITASGIAILPGGGGWRGALWRAAYSPAAEALILLVILANIAGMAADTPWFQPSPALGALELGCSVFYTVELVVKVLSLGGFAPYLADPWQSLDAFIVVGGWASELPSIVAAATGAPPPASVQLSALRGLRGLRALRAVRALTGVRELVETLAATLPVVARVLAFNVLIVGCMAAAAVDVFGAALQQRCALPAVAPAPMPATASLAAASGLLSPPAHQAVPPWPWALLTGPQAAATTAPALFCAAPARAPPALDPAALLNASTSVVLPSGDASSAGIPTTMLLPAPLTAAAFQRTAGQCGPLSSCAWSATSPNGGLSSFSSFLPALLTTFRLSLRAPGTDDVFLGGIEATSPWTVIFFVAVALVVSLSSLGLFVAIVRSSFTEIVQKRARLRLIRKSLARVATAPGPHLAGIDGTEGGPGPGPGPATDTATTHRRAQERLRAAKGAATGQSRRAVRGAAASNEDSVDGAETVVPAGSDGSDFGGVGELPSTGPGSEASAADSSDSPAFGSSARAGRAAEPAVVLGAVPSAAPAAVEGAPAPAAEPAAAAAASTAAAAPAASRAPAQASDARRSAERSRLQPPAATLAQSCHGATAGAGARADAKTEPARGPASASAAGALWRAGDSPAALPRKLAAQPAGAAALSAGSRQAATSVATGRNETPGAARLPAAALAALEQMHQGSPAQHSWLWKRGKRGGHGEAPGGGAPASPRGRHARGHLGPAAAATGDEAAAGEADAVSCSDWSRCEPPPRAPARWERAGTGVCLVLPRTSACVRATRWVVTSPAFDRIVLLLILGNTVALGLEHAGMSKAFASALAATSLAMTVVFCLESLLKTVALGGFYQYVVAEGTGWNRFDFFVVAVTALDVAVVLAAGGSPLEPTGAYANPQTGGFGPSGGLQNGGSGVNLSVLRVVRVVRVLRLLRLIRGFEDLKRLVRVIGATMHDVSSWLAVTAVLVVTFSVAGMQFFGGTMGVGAARPRAHFDTFGDAVLTVCRMMTGGGTWAILQAMMEAPAGQAGIPGSVLGPLFFVVFTITMNYQLLNFLTVLILSRFALSNDERARKQRERNRLHAGAVASKVRDIDKAVSAIIGRPTGRALRRSSSSASGSAQHVRGESSSLSLASSIESQTSIESALSPSSRPPACVESACAKTATAVSALDRRDLACCCIPRDGWLRRHARHLVSSPWFEGVVLVAIVVSSLALAVDSPDVDPAVASALAVADNVFLAIFWAEMLTKAVAGGFLFGSNSYLRGRDAAWNIIDLVVLVMTSASLGSTSGGAARVGRLGRVMRPLRAIRRNPQMRIVINALLRALPSVSWTLLLLAAVFVVWAILGVSLFAGTTHACNDASVDAKDDCVGWFGGPANATAAALLGVRSSASTLLFRPRVWAPSRSSFDSVPVALATLFEVFTLRSWTSTLYTVVDARGYNLQPRRDANPAASAFLLAFIWLAAVYMGKLFVGVIVGFFRQYSGSALLTAQQAEQRVTQSVLGASRVLSRPPTWSPCRLLHGLVVGRTALFDGSMVLVSLAHALAATVLAAAAAAERIGLSQANADAEAAPVEAARVSVHWAFTGLAALELLVRLMAYGGVAAWAASRSRAELVGDVLLVVLMVAVPLSTGATAGLAAVRLLYVCMRLLARRRTAVALGCGRVRRIAMVVVQALPALANVTALVLLFLFTWAVLGVQLFAGVRFGGTLGPQRSFRTFFDAAMALFGMVLGSDWTPLMDDVAREPPRCTPAASGVTVDCGSRAAALFFFVACHVLFAAVFSNLYTAAILDQYAVEGIRSKKEELLGSFDDLAATDAGQPRAEAQAEAAIVVFGRIWRAFDRTAVGSLTYKQLPGLVRTLWAVGHPFVAGTPCTPMAVNFVVCSILARQETPEAAASSLLESRIPAFATPTSPAGRLTRRISRASSGPLPSAEAKPGSPPAAGGDPAAGLRPAKRIRLALVLQALQQLTAEPSTMEPFEQELQAALSRLAIVVASAVSVKSAIQRMHARKLEAVDSSSS